MVEDWGAKSLKNKMKGQKLVGIQWLPAVGTLEAVPIGPGTWTPSWDCNFLPSPKAA